MWETDWSQVRGGSPGRQTTESSLAADAVESAYLLHWQEHCIECAVPECYKQCPLYVRRRDGWCARFEAGISPNAHYVGLYAYGAEVKFRRWGKLESTLGFGALSPASLRGFDRLDRIALTTARMASTVAGGTRRDDKLTGLYAGVRRRLLRALTRRRRCSFDEFVIEVWNLQSTPIRLVIECVQGEPRFRTSVIASPGKTLHQIPLEAMKIDLFLPWDPVTEGGLIRVYPENDAEAHLVFTWLDFIRYARRGERTVARAETNARGAVQKVKCVIWDLDNTVWDGILGEQGPDHVTIRPEVRRTMLDLDSRGILQSVASKNDYAEAWPVLERVGLSHLFLHPRINWVPKSVNIQDIVQELNIGVDACAFVDDSAFERAEVSQALQGIRLYSDTDVSELMKRPEFDVPVTEESRQRRLYYVAETKRKSVALDYAGDYERFLRSCKMKATLFRPTEPWHRERCLELLHRTNQLNLSTHRYDREEFEKLLGDPDALCICTACQDRFGDYGLVGFASLRRFVEGIYLVDFVLSCRVAQKKVENAWFDWLIIQARAMGYMKVHARYISTARNHVLLRAFLDAGFIEIETSEQSTLLELDCSRIPPMSEVVSLDGTAVGKGEPREPGAPSGSRLSSGG